MATTSATGSYGAKASGRGLTILSGGKKLQGGSKVE